MSDRPAFPAALVTALTSPNVSPIYFAEFQFDGGTLRLQTGIRPIAWGGHTWHGAGDLARLEQIEEGSDVSPYAMRLALSGIDSTILAEALGEDYYRRTVIFYMGALDDAERLVADPAEVFSGFVEAMPVTRGDPNGDTILCTVESEFAEFDRASQLKYTESQLQTDHPGDKGLEYLEAMVDVRPVWRGAQQSFGGRSGTGSRIAPGAVPFSA